MDDQAASQLSLDALIQCHQHHRLEVVVGELAVDLAQLLKQKADHLTADFTAIGLSLINPWSLDDRPI